MNFRGDTNISGHDNQQRKTKRRNNFFIIRAKLDLFFHRKVKKEKMKSRESAGNGKYEIKEICPNIKVVIINLNGLSLLIRRNCQIRLKHKICMYIIISV